MDIRDIKEVVKIPRGKELENMFYLQQDLLDHYVSIEGIPKYPFDLNSKNSQVIIKDFIARIIEELGEAFESYEIMMTMFHNGVDEKEMIPYLQNFNEEIADSIHFWLETLIVSGIEVSDLKGFYFSDTSKGSILLSWFLYAEGKVNLDTNYKKFPARYVIKDLDLYDEFLRGGRKLSKEIMSIMKGYLWDITYHLQLARNTLKNKPWKQSQMMTDEGLYIIKLKDATVSLFKFLQFTGFSPASLYEVYYKKNLVNKFRIKSKY